VDTLFLRDLTVHAIVGVNPDERTERQPLILNVELECDLSKACRSDHLDDTVNYKSLQDNIVREAEEGAYLLIERLAQRIAEVCLEDAMVHAVTVTVDKPRALRFARSAAVRITRTR
jgi:D-erythro-7,8-dihydroneopterin triphosphate epimerase